MKNWDKLYTDVLLQLKTNLAPFLTYHCWEHTVYVVEMVEHIALKEHSSEYNIILMKTAALFHDSGYMNFEVPEHEAESIRIAKEILPKYDYTENEIVNIVGMINATKIPQKPKNKMERILADADLEYLGTEHFVEIGTRLYHELKHYTPDLTMEAWDDIQIKFLQSHHYHTDYCLNYRTKAKEINLQLLLEKKY